MQCARACQQQHQLRCGAWRPCRAARSPRCCAAERSALVLGAGMAGLAAAQALARHRFQVTILERDRPPDADRSAVDLRLHDAQSRRGVTQFQHLHALVAKGVVSLDQLFDGRFSAGVAAAGGHVADALTQIAFVHPAGEWQRQPGRLGPVPCVLASRHVLEAVARRLVLEAGGHVRLLSGPPVAGLTFQGEGGDGSAAAVTGVTLADGSRLSADLVVDCTGRASALPAWLAAAGFPTPRESTAAAGCGYASWYTRLAPEGEAALTQGRELLGIYIMAAVPHNTMCILLQLEHGAWIAGAGGFDRHWPPMRDAQLVPWLRDELWHPLAGELLAGSLQLAPASRFYNVKSVWRHFEEQALPEGLLVMGDSLASFSPVYGQGISVAAAEACVLDELLAERDAAAASGSNDAHAWRAGLHEALSAGALPVLSDAWAVSVGTDATFASATSNEPPPSGLGAVLASVMTAYQTAAFRVAAQDSVVSEAMIRVLQLLDRPSRLLAPAVASRVLLGSLAAALAGLAPRPARDAGDAALAGGGGGGPGGRVGGGAV